MVNKQNMRKVLKKMKKVFGDVPHWIIGSLVLGHIRNKGFIKNEYEFDYIIHYKDLNKLIENLKILNIKIEISSEAINNNIVLRPIDNTNIIRIIKFELDGVPIDIAVGFIFGNYFYYLVKGDKYRVNKFPKKLFEKMIMEKFEGGVYSFPNTPMDYVERVYDKDWYIVKNDWRCDVNPPCLLEDNEANKIFNIIVEEYNV